MSVDKSGFERGRKVAAASIFRRLTMATRRRGGARGRLLTDPSSESSGKGTETSMSIRRSGPAFSQQQQQQYITSWILPPSLEPPLAPPSVSHLTPRYQNSLPALSSKSIRFRSTHHLHGYHLLPKLLWQPPDMSFWLYLALQPILYTAARVIPLEYRSDASPAPKPLKYPPASKQTPLQNRIQNLQGNAPSRDLVPDLLSNLILYHWRSFSIGQYHEHAKHTPATGPLYLIQPQQECSDSDSHTPHSLTSHIFLLTCHLLGQTFPDDQ